MHKTIINLCVSIHIGLHSLRKLPENSEETQQIVAYTMFFKATY